MHGKTLFEKDANEIPNPLIVRYAENEIEKEDRKYRTVRGMYKY